MDALYYSVYFSSLKAMHALLAHAGHLLDPNRVYGKKRFSILIVAANYTKDPFETIDMLLSCKNVKFNPN
jgi:hypothetical protein